mmetsp:Transcript_11624/g.17620  ORF Transcript_11624/g.17620 Transcript_11624/m.17620 type:complete len:119 (-) Transcript_11624:579-935(-)
MTVEQAESSVLYKNWTRDVHDDAIASLDEELNQMSDLAEYTDKCNQEDFLKTYCPQDKFTQVIIVCYFALTTLSTVGYGDYYPISVNEMIIGILFMLVGIVFFSQIMGSFIEIIQNYD